LIPDLQLLGRPIGAGHPAFVIAEAGVNHNGDPELARQLIRAAKAAGADCVKFQTFKAERVVTAAAPKAAYQLGTTDPAESQLAMLRSLELDPGVYRELLALAAAEGVAFFSTPYNEEDVDFLAGLGIGAFKLASLSVVEPAFLRYVARQGKPIVLSTGMATLDEVVRAVDAIRSAGNEQIVLLQCTTNYPSRLADVNLRAMLTMRDVCSVPVGYSDHTAGHTACIAAVALGACVIEKHFTLDKALPGPDHTTSCDPAEFAELMREIRATELLLGSAEKTPCEVERRNAIGMRRSIVARRAITAGEVLTSEMLAFKRPSTGIPPAQLDTLIGAVATRDIPADAMLTREDFARGAVECARVPAPLSTRTANKTNSQDQESAASPPWHHAPLHHFIPRGTYIVTASTLHRARLFDTPEKLDVFRDTFLKLADDYRLTLGAWAFLGNHYHAVVGFESAAVSLRVFLRHLHREIAHRLNVLDQTPARKVMHQFWDTELTNEKSWLARMHYVHHNPVHHGLVENACDYPWCSARWFETNASPSFFRTVYSFKIDRVKVPDEF
jgi:N-acetylneuraminate synthase/N,N'-diacetyllegionaminate synthase